MPIRVKAASSHLVGLVGLLVLSACWTRATPAPLAGPPLATSDPFHDLIAPSATCTAGSPAAISRAAALGDLAVLERIVRRGHVGFDRIVGLERVRQRLAALPEPIVVDELARAVVAELTPFDPTLTLTVYGPDGTARVHAPPHADAYTADLDLQRTGAAWTITGAAAPAYVGATLVACAAHDLESLLRPTFTSSPHLVARPIVVATAPPQPLSCTVRVHGTTAVAQFALRPLHRAIDPRSTQLEIHQAGIPLLRVRSLGDPDRPPMNQLATAARYLTHAPAFILDLRGNRGGASTAARSLLQALAGQPLRDFESATLTSEVTLQGRLNAATCALATTDDELDHEQLEVERRKLRALVDRAHLTGPRRDRRRDGRGALPTDALVDYPGTAILIVDAACAGTCELAVHHARQLPRTIVIGENTAGTLEHTDPLPYRLPASGLWMRVATRALVATPPDVLPPRGTGLVPDLWFDTADVDAALAILVSCARQPACLAALR